MRFTELELRGAWLVELEPHADNRGFFARTFCEEEFAKHGLPLRFPQQNLSRNTKEGTLRGMHWNASPHSEAKLVRCNSGTIWDVIVDLRRNSPTFLKAAAVELSASKGNALFIPENFAHGFLTLADDTDVHYLMGRSFTGGAARGARWNDPKLAIRWPRSPAVISEKDEAWPAFDEAKFDG